MRTWPRLLAFAWRLTPLLQGRWAELVALESTDNDLALSGSDASVTPPMTGGVFRGFLMMSYLLR